MLYSLYELIMRENQVSARGTTVHKIDVHSPNWAGESYRDYQQEKMKAVSANEILTTCKALNEQSVDKASYRNRGGLINKLQTAYKISRYFNKAGKNNLIRPHTEFRLTDNAYLEIGNNCTIQDYAFFQLTKPKPRVIIGNNVVIGRNNVIAAKSLISIGDDTIIGPFVQIIDHNHSFRKSKIIRTQQASIKNIIIEEDCWLGSGAKILKGVHLSVGVIVGANSVVINDVPPYAIVCGNPAKLIKYRE